MSARTRTKFVPSYRQNRAVDDEQRRQQPILGNMRPLRQEVQSQGAPMQADQLDQPQDDLPF